MCSFHTNLFFSFLPFFFVLRVLEEQHPLVPWRLNQKLFLGCARLLLQPLVLRLHSILYSTVYVEVLAHKTLLLSHEPTAVPELYEQQGSDTESQAVPVCPERSGLASCSLPDLVDWAA